MLDVHLKIPRSEWSPACINYIESGIACQEHLAVSSPRGVNHPILVREYEIAEPVVKPDMILLCANVKPNVVGPGI